MADPEQLTEQEEREEEERRRQGRPSLDEEIARRYDPQRLSRLVVAGAGRGEKLDLAMRGEMERLHPGHDFSDVRVFRGALAEEVTRRHGADAVTVANTGMIMLRETPRSAPGTTSGRALIAHEVTHVAQAQRGLHFALAHGHGEGGHEHEAEAIERGVTDGGDGDDGGDAHEQDNARTQTIIARVLEMMVDDLRLANERSGNDWE